jgi:hypothetical protein
MDMQDRGQILKPDSTHRVATRWKWTVVLLTPFLTGLMAWAIVLIVGNLRFDAGWENVALTGVIVAMLLGLILVAIGAPVWAFRARMMLSSETMALRGIFGTRILGVQDLEGYRWIKGKLHLYLKSDQWPVNLSYFSEQAVLNAWVFNHAVDLNAAELAEEDRRIGKDVTLGMTEAQKEEQLARLRGLTKKINWVAYGVAAVGVLNAWFFEDPKVQEAVAAVLVAMPIGMVLLALGNPGHVRLDYPEGSRYPEIFTGILACSLAIGLMSVSDRHTLLGDMFYRLWVPFSVVNAAIWALIDLDRLREHYARGRALAAITVASLLLFSAFWVGGAIYQANKNFDTSEAIWSRTEVVDKRLERHKSTVEYYIEVAPWDGSGGEAVELNVSKDEYGSVAVGATIEIGVRRGALEIPWVAEIRPAKKRRLGH